MGRLKIWNADAGEWQYVVSPPSAGGGSQAGATILKKFAVAHDSAGLYTAAGFPLFTTTAGEVILDTWFDGSVDWDAGTTPLMDLGSAAELFNNWGWWIASGNTPVALNLLIASHNTYTDSTVTSDVSLSYTQIQNSANALPRKYAGATPIVAISWDDSLTSQDNPAPYGATAGALDLYVLSAVPA